MGTVAKQLLQEQVTQQWPLRHMPGVSHKGYVAAYRLYQIYYPYYQAFFVAEKNRRSTGSCDSQALEEAAVCTDMLL